MTKTFVILAVLLLATAAHAGNMVYPGGIAAVRLHAPQNVTVYDNFNRTEDPLLLPWLDIYNEAAGTFQLNGTVLNRDDGSAGIAAYFSTPLTSANHYSCVCVDNSANIKDQWGPVSRAGQFLTSGLYEFVRVTDEMSWEFRNDSTNTAIDTTGSGVANPDQLDCVAQEISGGEPNNTTLEWWFFDEATSCPERADYDTNADETGTLTANPTTEPSTENRLIGVKLGNTSPGGRADNFTGGDTP